MERVPAWLVPGMVGRVTAAGCAAPNRACAARTRAVGRVVAAAAACARAGHEHGVGRAEAPPPLLALTAST